MISDCCVGGIGVRVRERDGDDGAGAVEQRARIAALLGLGVEIAHVRGETACDPVAKNSVAGHGGDRRETDAREAERARFRDKERGGSDGIERRGHGRLG